MTKTSYEDPIKDKWRDAWLNFIRKHRHLLHGKPRNWNVIFLPGEEALELRVYDQLKIPRENLLGLERDPQSHEKLKKKNLGIRLTDNPIDALDFFKQTDEVFDIVNLDYKGHFNPAVEVTLHNIAKRQILNEESIVALTFYGKREKKSTQEKYKGIYAVSEAMKKINNSKGSKLHIKANIHDITLKDARDDSITKAAMGYFDRSLPPNLTSPFLKRNPNYNHLQEIIEKFKKNTKWNGPINLNEISQVVELQLRAFEDYLINKGIGQNRESVEEIVKLAMRCEKGPYFLKDIARYSYVSSDSALMLSDFFVLSQYKRVFKKYQYLVDHAFKDLDSSGFLKSLTNSTRITKKEARKANQIVRADVKTCDYIAKAQTSDFPERIYLGSSAKLPRLTGQEYYNQRFEDHSKGIEKEETWDRLITDFKVTRSQLPKFEAHYSRESHGPKFVPQPEVTPENSAETLEERLIFNENSIIPQRSWNYLSKVFQERITYFITDDIQRLGLNPDDTCVLLDNILASKWYKNKNDISDLQFYAFFDDIMIEMMNKGEISQDRIITLLENVAKPDWKETHPKRSTQMLTLDIYSQLVEAGKTDEWIANNYRTEKPNSLRAYKAWYTMKHGKQVKKDLGPQMIQLRREGKTKQEVMEILNLKEFEYRGYLAAFKRGDYDSIIKRDQGKSNAIIDSHGVVHFNANIKDIEKGYK